MRKQIIGGMLCVCLGALVSVGCAKKEVVKPEEPVAAVQTTPTTPAPEAVKPAPRETAPEQVRSEPIAETPTKEAVITPEATQPAPKGVDLQAELQKIYFNFDSADLSEESRNALSKNADILAKNPGLKLRIEGNCDERGSDEYNMALGERRAKAAKDYLVNLGVQPDRITTISYGEEKPAVSGEGEAAWSKNRRDEFVIVR